MPPTLKAEEINTDEVNMVSVYNTLSRDDQCELLRQMVERAIVDSAGNVKLMLRAPFAYLQDISDQICSYSGEIEDTQKYKNRHCCRFE